MKGILKLITFGTAVAMSMAAQATTIDFEDLSVGDTVTDQYADEGIIFDTSGLAIWNYSSSLQACPADTSTCAGDIGFHFVDPNDGVSAASTDSLSFQLGDAGGDLDSWYIHIFDSNMVELESRYVASNAFTTQSFSFADISSVWIEWATPSSAGYLLDNIVFNTPTSASVPEPSSLALLGLGLAGLGFSRRKKA